MSLRDLVEQDISNLFLDTSGEGVAASYTPRGASSSFPLVVCFSMPAMIHIQSGPTTESREKSDMLVLATVVRTGILGITTESRDPIRGDKITIAQVDSAEYFGDWMVLGFYPDGLGGLILQTQRVGLESIGGESVEEVDS